MILQFFLFGFWVVFELAAEQTQLENDCWSKEVKTFMSIWTFHEPLSEEIRKQKPTLRSLYMNHLSITLYATKWVSFLLQTAISQLPWISQRKNLSVQALSGPCFPLFPHHQFRSSQSLTKANQWNMLFMSLDKVCSFLLWHFFYAFEGNSCWNT